MHSLENDVASRVRYAGLTPALDPAKLGETRTLALDTVHTYQCSVPLIREQSLCSFSRMESAEAVHMNGLQFSL